MSKFEVGETVLIVWGSKMWDGKRKITELYDYGNDKGVIVKADNGVDGAFAFRFVKKLRIDNWMERIV